jgi:hypothetical protein
MIENFRLSLKRPLFRLALVGAISVLLVGALAPEALGASSPTPTPKKSQTTPTPTPRVNQQGQKEPKEKVTIGKAPKTPTSLNARTARAIRAADPASLAVTNCGSLSGTPAVCTFDLWARSGNVSTSAAPGLSSHLPIWGFTTNDEGQGLIPGPLLIARTTQQVRIRLHNQLITSAGNLSLDIPAASSLTPDLDGIARGGVKTYNFGTLQPGTYMYQAGPTANAPRQILMGLSGLLIVRPDGYTSANTSAYGTTASQFQAEATLQVNEFDSAFNRNPIGSDPNTYEPDVFLANGRGFDPAHVSRGQIEVLANSTLLLHYANLGNHDRGFTVLNHRQKITADDSSGNFANPLGTGQFVQRSRDVTTAWLTAGQVSDSFITVDPQNTEGTRIPIFESGFHLADAAGGSGLGGMLTSLLVHGLNGSPNGPITSVAVGATTVAGTTPFPGFTGTQALTFSGSMSSPSSVLQSEWFLDTLTAPGAGRLFNTTECDGGFTLTSGTNPNFSCTISAIRLNALLLASPPVDADHVIWVHGSNSGGGWGTVTGDVFTYNITGPDTGALSVHLTPTNGARINDIANGAGPGFTYAPTSDLVLLGTSTQSLADWTVLKGEYCLDSTSCANGAGTALYLTPPMTSGPAGAPILAGPDPAGTACSSPNVDYGTPGNGNVLPDAPGGAAVVAWCGFVSTATLNGLSEGSHTLYAHAYEAPAGATTGGRWGSYGLAGASATFVVDKTGPVTSSIAIDPSPNNGKSSQSGNLNFLDSLQISARLTDNATPIASNIALAEVFVSSTTQDPTSNPALFVTGTGAEMIPANAVWGDATVKQAYGYIPLAVLTSYPDGPVKFWIHAQDVAGSWGAFSSLELTVDRRAPVLTAVAPTANGSNVGSCTNSSPCVIHFSATDPGPSATPPAVATNIISGEWYLGQNIVRLPGDDVATSNDPGLGMGIPFSIDPAATTVTNRTFAITSSLIAQYLVAINATAATLPPGSTINIVFRVRDAAGNWSNNRYVVGTA